MSNPAPAQGSSNGGVTISKGFMWGFIVLVSFMCLAATFGPNLIHAGQVAWTTMWDVGDDVAKAAALVAERRAAAQAADAANAQEPPASEPTPEPNFELTPVAPDAAPESAASGHYLETKKGQTQTWTIDVPAGAIAIVGGYKVDGISGGVYKAFAGPITLATTVTDGFVKIVSDSDAQQEFCFRVIQAVDSGWAHDVIMPLSTWPSCW